MSNYISGSSSKIGAHIETDFNEMYDNIWSRPNEVPVRMTSESLQATYNKLDEGVLMASKTLPDQELGSVSVSGDVDTVLNPNFVEWFLEASFGAHDRTQTDIGEEPGISTDRAIQIDDVYTLAGINDLLPSSGLELWRGTQGFYYSGMTVSNMSLEATAQDFVHANISFAGTKETYLGKEGTQIAKGTDPETYYTLEPNIDTSADYGSFKCTKAKLRYGADGSDELADFTTDWISCPRNTVYDVQTSTLTLDNGLDSNIATYCSGLYSHQPSHGQRSVTLACNVPYSDEFETFRQQYYANENPAKLALLLQFTNKNTFTYMAGNTETTVPAHQIFVIIPHVSISAISANASGQGIIDGSFTGTALSVNNDEPIKVIYRHFDFQADSGVVVEDKTYVTGSETDTWTFADVLTSTDANNYVGCYRDVSSFDSKTVSAGDIVFYIMKKDDYLNNAELYDGERLSDDLAYLHANLDNGTVSQGTTGYDWSYDFALTGSQSSLAENYELVYVLGRVKSGEEVSTAHLHPSDIRTFAVCNVTITPDNT